MQQPVRATGVLIPAILCAVLALSGCASPRSYGQNGSGSQADGANSEIGRLVRYCKKFRDENNMEMAVALCRRALEVDPTNQDALMTFAGIMESKNVIRGAGNAYRRVLALNPDHTEARYGLAKAYLRLEQYGLAQRHFEMGLEASDGEARFYNGLGVAQDKLGAHEAAQDTYRSGLANWPDDVNLRTNLGLSLVTGGRPVDGLDVLRQAADYPEARMATRRALSYAYAVIGDLLHAEEVALIDFPPDVAKALTAQYKYRREAGSGALSRADPAAPRPAATTPPVDLAGSLDGMPAPVAAKRVAAQSKPFSVPPATCKVGRDNPFCMGKR